MSTHPTALDRDPENAEQQCDSMVVLRPERDSRGVILICTRPIGHDGDHEHTGFAEEWPVVPNTADLIFDARWRS